jgi:carbonic anhydrase/acetyltransferase-like protein (isoleucine patch superfamily)
MTKRKIAERRTSPRVESLERRELLSTVRLTAEASHLAGLRRVDAAVVAAARSHPSVAANRPVEDAADGPSEATFIDPTAVIRDARATTFGTQDYVAPFATLSASGGATISIGNGSNVQDNVEITAAGRHASVMIGDHAIVAHGATVVGPAEIGAPGGAPAFVGFNAVIDGATVEPGAMVMSLAKVAPGIVIPTGIKVLPGMYIKTQAEADDINLGKVEDVEPDDIDFMIDVIHVNEAFAAGYSQQALESPSSVRGIGPNPPTPPFNPMSSTPTLAGVPTLAPRFRDRIIGDVRMTDSLARLYKVMGHDDSIRADEASPFLIGRIARMGNRVTIHGLEYTNLLHGHGDSFGYHSVVHGGADTGEGPNETTIVGDRVRIGAWAVVFRSKIGDGCVIGPYAYIDNSTLKPGMIVPRGAIIINNQYRGMVQWIC